jgi:diguanylate cyclase (GGDEF)-like protein
MEVIIMDGERVLIVEPDSRLVELAVIKLSNSGWLVAVANDGEEAYEKASSNPPDVLVINPNLEKKDGYELCSDFKKNEHLKNIPVIFLVDQSFNEERFSSLKLGMCEILTKPFSPKNLLNKVNSLSLKSRLVKKMNPLTELPGKQYLEEELNQLIQAGSPFDLVFTDLKGFTSYNKAYGFDEGNKVIQYIVTLLQEEISKSEALDGKVYHFGGDDFCILLKPGYASDLSKRIIERFDSEIARFYQESDRARGGLIMTNRRGLVEQWPIMTLAIVLISNSNRKINNWLEAEMIASEMLKYTKSMPGSHFTKDRRSS